MGACGSSDVKIETIDESKKSLQTVPKALTRSSIRKSVRQVNLSDNDLKQIDAKFWLNINLEEIILSGNKNLELIPDQVATLTKLQILDLSGTSLKKVNDLLWSLPKLKVLNLSSTKITGLGNISSKSLTTLDISRIGLTELPEEIKNLQNLHVLQANDNKLTKIPKSIGELSKLSELFIQNNELSYLPNVENVKKLKKLKISDDQDSVTCELFEAELNGETVLSCSYFKCPSLPPTVPKRIDSLAKESTESEIKVTINTEEVEVKAEIIPPQAAPPVSDSDTADKISEKSSSGSSSSSSSSSSSTPEKEEKDEKSESLVDEECKGKDEFVLINDYHFRTLAQSLDSGGEIKVEACEITPEVTEVKRVIHIETESVEIDVNAETVAETETQEIKELGVNVAPIPSTVTAPVADEVVENPAEKPVVSEKPEIAPKPVQPEEQNASVEEYIGTQIEPVSVDTGLGSEKDETKSEKSEQIEDKSDSEDEKKDETECHQTEILKHRGMGSVRRSKAMFENAQIEAAQDKPSTPIQTRRMSARTSYRTDQPSITGDGVVRVAVPIPENFKEKKVERAPIKTGRVEDIWDKSDQTPLTPPATPTTDLPEGISVAARSASIQSALSKSAVKTVTTVKTGETVETGDHGETITTSETITTTKYSFSSLKIEDEHLQPERNVSKIEIASSKAESVPVEVAMTETINQKLKQIDYELDPREINAKANKTKGSALGLSIIAASEEDETSKLEGNAIVVKEVLEMAGTTWSGDSPKTGDVLVSIDGSQVNDDNISDILSDCGNVVQLKFNRYPSAFTGYN